VNAKGVYVAVREKKGPPFSRDYRPSLTPGKKGTCASQEDAHYLMPQGKEKKRKKKESIIQKKGGPSQYPKKPILSGERPFVGRGEKSPLELR